jgi:hypothetical protein
MTLEQIKQIIELSKRNTEVTAQEIIDTCEAEK